MVRGAARASSRCGALAEAVHFDPALRARLPEPELVVTQFHDPRATYSNGAIAALVEVDLGTGGVTVRRLAVVEDCGTMLNPTIVEGQAAGAVAQGSAARCWRTSPTGPTAARAATRSAPTCCRGSPSCRRSPSATTSRPSPLTVNGVKGMGESGAIAAPAAIACAVADALAPEGFVVRPPAADAARACWPARG